MNTTDNFSTRHNGIRANDLNTILSTIQTNSVDELITQTVPQNIRLKHPLNLPPQMSEFEYLNHINQIAQQNKLFKTYIGMGYYNTITPSVILRNIFENPGWYTAYTPYQAEISQGRMEALLNYQTMVMDLTGMAIANASLLDEATAAAEAMTMLYEARKNKEANVFYVSDKCFPQTIDVLITRSQPIGILVKVVDIQTITLTPDAFGMLIQYPDNEGNVLDYKQLVETAHQNNMGVAVATDLLSLTMLTPPGQWGADVVVGNSQRFGVPMGYGGPHAAFFAAKEDFKRLMPGRIIGVSVDKRGKPALRMALQTREQHIKRERATSNICTAQALLAIMASMYAVYHGPKGLKRIANTIHSLTATLKSSLEKLGCTIINQNFFDTLTIALPNNSNLNKLETLALQNEINFRYFTDKQWVGISIDETTSLQDVNKILEIFATAIGASYQPISELSHKNALPENLQRTSDFLTHPVFNTYHSETEMMRYIKSLENKDLSLTRSMISLGSCTMKLNAASELIPLSNPLFNRLHPFVPKDQAQGYEYIIDELGKYLCEITGFAGVSFQPNSGAQGEYAGLMVIRQYHIDHGQGHRNVVLIPSSAHGTNPASAAMAAMKIVVVSCDSKGNIDVNDLKQKVEQHKDNLSCLMVTYPSTHGVFEESITDITKIIHDNGGLVYMDGANMNAQVGLTNPGSIGADVCHLNLHKTFAIPHGGGGPGMGPICVAKHLVPYLPSHRVVNSNNDPKAIHAVSAAPYGSALILLISYAYIRMMGAEGLTEATKIAILNANYMKSVLEKHFTILYTGNNNRVAHEMIVDFREFKRTAGIEVEDIAKRLMDYGFHAPTVSFPVPGTLMIEPTESEPLAELDRFCQTLISIKNEIEEIANGQADKQNNVLKNAPHTADMVITDNYQLPYSRQKAVFPAPWIINNKYWPTVARVDNAYGDRNLICSCYTPEFEEQALLTN